MHPDMLSLLQQLINVQTVNFTILKPPYDNLDQIDLEFRKTVLKESPFSDFLKALPSHCHTHTLYYMQDFYRCSYALFQLPEKEYGEGVYAITGPYLEKEITPVQLSQIEAELKWPPALSNELLEYYNSIPVIHEANRFHAFLSCMVSQFFDNSQEFSIQHTDGFFNHISTQKEYTLDSTPLLSFRLIEERYQLEEELLKEIASGNFNKAQLLLQKFLQHRITPRYKDPLRDIKNLTIVLNTMYRKAVQNSHVHPIHIDELSRRFAIQIESCLSIKEIHDLIVTMTRKYCMLVQNYSLQGYSPLIRKVINYIDGNLSETFSLKHLSDMFSVNSSYLSTLFKKEMGLTVTDYINQQKIRYAVMLLNRTDSQIQNIASQVGINDVNYFIKLFKKINGMTPGEYRDSIK